MPRRNNAGRLLERFSLIATKAAGSSNAFVLAAAVVVGWLITGPLFGFSDTWQLVINTGTTIVTFLMVFLIQRAQNKDALALHLKLNELIAAVESASNRLIDVEDLTEEEMETLHQHYRQLVERSKKEFRLFDTHSLTEADARHERKRHARRN